MYDSPKMVFLAVMCTDVLLKMLLLSEQFG